MNKRAEQLESRAGLSDAGDDSEDQLICSPFKQNAIKEAA